MRIDLPELKNPAFELSFPIRWGDMDVMGHVNNTVYFRYFEAIRIEWMVSVGATPNPQGEGPVIANTWCNFVHQLEYPGEVLGKLYLANPGRSSFDTFITLERRDQPGRIDAHGGATTVWVDFATHQSKTLPDWLRSRIG